MANLSAGTTTGLTLKVEAIRLLDGKRLDWADGTFKSSGWTTLLQAMTEDAVTLGYYTLVVDTTGWNASSLYRFLLTDVAQPDEVIAVQELALVNGDLVPSTPPTDALCTLAAIKGRLRLPSSSTSQD